jgi:hypothetical protein
MIACRPVAQSHDDENDCQPLRNAGPFIMCRRVEENEEEENVVKVPIALRAGPIDIREVCIAFNSSIRECRRHRMPFRKRDNAPLCGERTRDGSRCRGVPYMHSRPFWTPGTKRVHSMCREHRKMQKQMTYELLRTVLFADRARVLVSKYL